MLQAGKVSLLQRLEGALLQRIVLSGLSQLPDHRTQASSWSRSGAGWSRASSSSSSVAREVLARVMSGAYLERREPSSTSVGISPRKAYISRAAWARALLAAKSSR